MSVIILSLLGGSDSSRGHEGVASLRHILTGWSSSWGWKDLATPPSPVQAPDPDLAAQGFPDWFVAGHVTQAGPMGAQPRVLAQESKRMRADPAVPGTVQGSLCMVLLTLLSIILHILQMEAGVKKPHLCQ